MNRTDALPHVHIEAMIRQYLELPDDMRRVVGACVTSLHETHTVRCEGWASVKERDDAMAG